MKRASSYSTVISESPATTFLSRSAEDQLLLLAEASETLIRGENPEEIVRRILDLARQLFEADAYAIWRHQEGSWWAIEEFGLPADYPRKLDGDGPVMPDAPFVIADVMTHSLTAARREAYAHHGIRGMVGLPLRLHGKPAGSITFYRMKSQVLSPPDLRVARALANLASAAITSSEDYQEQQRLRKAAEAAQQRLTFLSEASAVLSSSLDYETTLRHVARLVVPYLADWCTVHLTADGKTRQVAVTHADPERVAWAESLRDRYPEEPDARRGLARVLRTGEPELYPEITDEMLQSVARDPEHLEMLRQVGFTACMIVPLRARGEVFGAISFISAESGSLFRPEDLTLAEALADRVASAIENARLYQTSQESLASLQRSEARARRLFESGVVGTTIWKLDGRILDANHVFLSLLGYTREDLEAGRLNWNDLTAPEWRGTNHDRSSGLPEKRFFSAYEKQYVRRDGTRVPVIVGGTLFDDSDDEGISFILDASEAVMLREELRSQAAELAEANRRKDEFLAILGHELRNPLAPVVNALQVVRTIQPRNPDLEPQLEVMDRQVHHLTRLVDDLLDVARISRGTVTIRSERVDAGQVAVRAVEVVRSRVEAAGQTIESSVPAIPIWVDADPTRLEQIFINLLGNAIKYSPTGGRIALTVRATSSGEAEGDMVEIRVQDNGFGIAPDLLPNIFEPFTQGSQSLARSEGGLGIGLTLVNQLVRMHGGEIQAFSAGEGQGSEFVVRLPAAGSTTGRGATGVVTVGAEVSRRVLIIDDNRDAADTLGDLLEAWGHRVSVAYGGLTGLQRARDFKPDLILLDLGMPGMDGYEVARQAREDEELRKIPLVALTGYGQDEDRRRTRAAGFAEHVVKPITAEGLRSLMIEIPAPAPEG